MRTLAAVALGFAAGLCVGPVSLFGVYARHVWRKGEAWPELSAQLLAAAVVSSLPAALNGAIGAGWAVRGGSRRRAVVAVIPVSLHVFVGSVVAFAEPQSFVGFQLYALLWSAVIWSAGRVGQRIGGSLVRRPSPLASHHS